MQSRFILLALASVGATCLLLYLVFGDKPLIPLTPLEPPPRPPVHADKQSPPQLLSGLLDPFPAAVVEDVVNAKRRARNTLAARHAKAVALWKQGQTPLRSVEAIEQMLVVARERTGELTTQEMHEQLALLFEREVTRLERLQASGFAGQDQVARARLYLARELYLAGKSESDPRAAGYPTQRESYLTAIMREHDTLVRSGLAPRSHMDLENEALLRDFPPVP